MLLSGKAPSKAVGGCFAILKIFEKFVVEKNTIFSAVWANLKIQTSF
jgi:hypothetical protein